ncbi:MAG: hypothetical protein H6Q90_5117 [Deltaproteobacteria bacterium]|nr:hypothetical protein [Deltaproteobacteria bacterium]
MRRPVLAALVAGVAILAATLIAVTAPHPEGPFKRPGVPPAVGAYRAGGAPAHDVAIEHVLGELANLAPATAERHGRASVLRERPAIPAMAWRGLVDSLERFDATAVDRAYDDEVAELRAYVQTVSDQLAGAGLGYFLDLEMTPSHQPVIAAYRVEKVTFVRADRERVRVLDLRALVPDTSRTLLGMKPAGLNDPVVLLDEIDGHVKTQLLPVLDGRAYTLADDGWAHTARARVAADAAGQAVRRELTSALGSDRDVMDRALARSTKLVLASIRHHEAQHGLEQEHVPALPSVLAALVGPVRDSRGRPGALAIRARNELSAYTSQLASDMWLPQVTLWSLSRHAFRSARKGSPESYVAVIVLEGLARQLAIASPGPVIHGGEIDRDRLAALVAPLAARSTVELRSAAARLWAELFGAPLVRLVDDVFGE